MGLAVNGALALAKLGVGLAAGSQALMADGWHSLSDLVTNGGAWVAHRWSGSPPDEDHHYGHGNLEAVSGMLIGLVLVIAGLSLLATAWGAELELESGPRGWLAVGMAVVSMGANLWLTHVTLRSSRELNSPSLRALARDNGSDVLSGGLVVLAVLGSMIGLDWAEPAVTFLIGALIAFMGWRSGREGFDVLMDRVPDPSLRGLLMQTARSVPGVVGVQSARVHPLGATYRVDMEISVDARLTVAEGHAIAHRVDRAIVAAHPHVEEVNVHVNPAPGEGPKEPPAEPPAEQPAEQPVENPGQETAP